MMCAFKDFLICNEEILVVFCFCAFIYAAGPKVFSQLEESIFERSEEIKVKLHRSYTLEREYLVECVHLHEKHLFLDSSMSALFVLQQMKQDQIKKVAKNNLKKKLTAQENSQESVKRLLVTSNKTQIQRELANSFFKVVFKVYNTNIFF